MNWTHFLLWLGGIYALYYTAIILIDSIRNKKPAILKNAGHELTFAEPVTPLNAVDLLENHTVPTSAETTAQPPSAPDMIASGGVLLKDVFSLARKEAIIYIKEVSF